MPVDSLIIGFEINDRLASYVCQQIRDRRLVMIQDSAEKLPSVLRRLGLSHIDVAVSSLGLTGMEPRLRRSIVESVVAEMRPGGIFTQYQYVHSRFGYLQLSRLRFQRFDEWNFLQEFFPEVERRWVGWNLPPAFVFTCRK
jgi:phospholipid N-methyltransferase